MLLVTFWTALPCLPFTKTFSTELTMTACCAQRVLRMLVRSPSQSLIGMLTAALLQSGFRMMTFTFMNCHSSVHNKTLGVVHSSPIFLTHLLCCSALLHMVVLCRRPCGRCQVNRPLQPTISLSPPVHRPKQSRAGPQANRSFAKLVSRAII